MVYPVTTVTLGQSMAVVIGPSLYFLASLWDRMGEKEIAMAGKAANLGREWIEDHPAALALIGRLQTRAMRKRVVLLTHGLPSTPDTRNFGRKGSGWKIQAHSAGGGFTSTH